MKTPVTQKQDGAWSQIVDAEGWPICNGLSFEEATKIRTAVNAHDALVAALEKIAVLSYGLLADDEARSTAVGIAKAALTAARGE